MKTQYALLYWGNDLKLSYASNILLDIHRYWHPLSGESENKLFHHISHFQPHKSSNFDHPLFYYIYIIHTFSFSCQLLLIYIIIY